MSVRFLNSVLVVNSVFFLVSCENSGSMSTKSETRTPMKVEFAVPQNAGVNWDGQTIPDGQQCKKYGGLNPETPALVVSNIAPKASALIFAYSDRDYKEMDDGGHGVIRFDLPDGAKDIFVPPIRSNTYDLPEGFSIVKEHRGTERGLPGAYMPPCSGGYNNLYYVTIQAVNGNQILSETIFQLGRY